MVHRSLPLQFSDSLCKDVIGRSVTRYGELKGVYCRHTGGREPGRIIMNG